MRSGLPSSCMLLDPVTIIPKAIERLSPGYFYIPAHKIIFEALLHLYKTRPEGKLDLIVLNTELANQGTLDAVGGPKTLADLLDDVPTIALFDDYAEFLKEKFILRRVIQDCTECVTEAYSSPGVRLSSSIQSRKRCCRSETRRLRRRGRGNAGPCPQSYPVH